MKHKEIAILIYTVISNAEKSIKSEEWQPFSKVDTSRKVTSSTLKKVVQKFNPHAKNIQVIIERVYERRKRDYFTTVTVIVDKFIELFTPGTFVSWILANL